MNQSNRLTSDNASRRLKPSNKYIDYFGTQTSFYKTKGDHFKPNLKLSSDFGLLSQSNFYSQETFTKVYHNQEIHSLKHRHKWLKQRKSKYQLTKKNGNSGFSLRNSVRCPLPCIKTPSPINIFSERLGTRGESSLTRFKKYAKPTRHRNYKRKKLHNHKSNLELIKSCELSQGSVNSVNLLYSRPFQACFLTTKIEKERDEYFQSYSSTRATEINQPVHGLKDKYGKEVHEKVQHQVDCEGAVFFENQCNHKKAHKEEDQEGYKCDGNPDPESVPRLPRAQDLQEKEIYSGSYSEEITEVMAILSNLYTCSKNFEIP